LLAKLQVVQKEIFITAKTNEEPYWSFVWEDLPPHLISWEQTLVRIEESNDAISWNQLRQNGRPIDDSGYDIAILRNDIINKGKTGLYETRWYNPPVGEKEKYYRFVILPQAEQDFLYSASFK